MSLPSAGSIACQWPTKGEAPCGAAEPRAASPIAATTDKWMSIFRSIASLLQFTTASRESAGVDDFVLGCSGSGVRHCVKRT
jgi:hypothetical protein